MKVLVDYDNLGIAIKRRGLKNLADKILDRLAAQYLPGTSAVDFRLYGGWDRSSRLTPDAQNLSAELRRTFPHIWNMPHSVRATMRLVYSIEAYPNKTLSDTLRTEPLREVKFSRPTLTTCREGSDCPLEDSYLFFRENRCPRDGCPATPQNLATQNVQKMVDTMMVADMIHLAYNGVSKICIVGGDDDMWPGILGAIAGGATIVHLQPNFTGYNATKYLPQDVTKYEGMPL